MIITRTPFRISFLGGGTDYPQWYREHGGAVLVTAIDKYCYINCRYLPPFFEHHSRIIYSRIENVGDNRQVEHPAVRACLAHAGVEAGVEIHHDADLPARTGLGTSSAFVVGLLHALAALRGVGTSPSALAREAITIEQDVLRENVGVQDQLAAAHGGFLFIRLRSGGGWELLPLRLSASRLEDLHSRLHLYFTGFSRTASEVAYHQIVNIPHRHAELRELQGLAEEGRSLLEGTAPLSEFGALLDQAWRLKRRLSSFISRDSLDDIYNRALAAGAEGGKLLGAGGGGFFLFLVAPERADHFRRRMEPLMRVPVRLAAGGSELVVHEPSEPFGPGLVAQRRRAYGGA